MHACLIAVSFSALPTLLLELILPQAKTCLLDSRNYLEINLLDTFYLILIQCRLEIVIVPKLGLLLCGGFGGLDLNKKGVE